jgi:ADP-dependent NAD(P)H-hydrate dehydratase / NAD(P)H-hydrate epimerase
LALGPSLTTDTSTAALVHRVVSSAEVPLVVDADALNAFAGHPAALSERRSDAIITPHLGEFSRLTGRPTIELGEDRVGAARKAAAEFGCVVLLKGSRTVVAEPDGRAVVNPTGGPFLATGGTGDVLTGTIAALVAQRLRPADAAVLGAYVHGLAGRRAARDVGPVVVASDVAARIPAALAELRDSR